MDVDNDIDAQLMQQFLSMGTQDREVLVSELQRLLGNQLNPEACKFFLDMNNWNLQAAIGSYYDYEQHTDLVPLPSMSFVKDVTIGEGESVRPNVNFVKTWKIKNTGSSAWPSGCALKFIMGYQLGSTERVIVESLSAGNECDVSVPMTSPKTAGMYHGQWRMSTSTGTLFGDTIWVILQVSETGLLDITQGMSRCGGDLGNAGPHSPFAVDGTYNPFNSPNKNTLYSTPSESMLSQTPSTSTIGSSAAVISTTTNATTTMTTATMNLSPNSTSSFNGASWHIDFQSKEEDMQ